MGFPDSVARLRTMEDRHVSSVAPLRWLVVAAILIVTAGWPPRSAAAPNNLTNSVGMTFVLIPAGEFTMGAPKSEPNADDDEQPQHRVTISQPFYLSQYEVTQAQWQAVMGVAHQSSRFQGENRPVEQVSWDEAHAFIKALNKRETKTSGLLCRLPTEAQWEYAARAGTSTPHSFGDNAAKLGDYAWYDKNAEGETHPVGQKNPNAWGLYDMYGNVWEWMQDWYGPYPANAVQDPSGPAAGAGRVIRGGSWFYPATGARSANRSRQRPGERRSYLGFRIACSVPSP